MTFRRRAICAFLCVSLLAGCAVRQRTHEEDMGSAVKELALLPYDITKGAAGLSWFIAYNMYKYAPKVAYDTTVFTGKAAWGITKGAAVYTPLVAKEGALMLGRVGVWTGETMYYGATHSAETALAAGKVTLLYAKEAAYQAAVGTPKAMKEAYVFTQLGLKLTGKGLADGVIYGGKGLGYGAYYGAIGAGKGSVRMAKKLKSGAYYGAKGLGYGVYYGVKGLGYGTYYGVKGLGYGTYYGVKGLGYGTYYGVKGLGYGTYYGVKGLGYGTYKGTILAGSAAWQSMKLFAKLLYNTPEYLWTGGTLVAKETAKATVQTAIAAKDASVATADFTANTVKETAKVTAKATVWTAKGTMYVAKKTPEVTYDVTKGAILLVPTVSKMALEDCFTPKSESLCRRLIVTILMK